MMALYYPDVTWMQHQRFAQRMSAVIFLPGSDFVTFGEFIKFCLQSSVLDMFI